MATKRWTDGAADGNWATAGNWSPSGAPATGDDVYVEESSREILLGLSQAAVALVSLNVSKGFTGKIGSKATPLEIGASAVNIGYDAGGVGAAAGSTRLHFDFGSTTAPTITVFGSASSSADTGLNPVRIKVAHASATLNIRGGFVSLADFPGETSTLSAISISSGRLSAGQPAAPSAVTVTTFTATGGLTRSYSTAPTSTIEGGTVTFEGTGAITTANVRGGTAVFNNTGTITTLNADGGLSDFTQSQRARTVTTANIKLGGRIRYEPDVLTLTNKINVNESKSITVSVS